MASKANPIYEEATWVDPGPSDVIGPVVSGYDVELAVAEHIRLWMPWYLTSAERQRGLDEGSLPMFQSQVASSRESDRLRDDRFPALALIANGLRQKPEQRADGMFQAKWRIDCQAICVAAPENARMLAQIYVAAIRALIMQPHDVPETELDPLRFDWEDEAYTTRSATQARTVGEGTARMTVHVNRVLDRSRGPRRPPVLWTLQPVRSKDVRVTKKGEPESPEISNKED